MAAKALCKIDIGKMYQTVYIDNEKYSGKRTLETYQTLLVDLPKLLSEQQDVNEVHLFGVSKDFAKHIEEETKEEQLSKYGLYNKKFIY